MRGRGCGGESSRGGESAEVWVGWEGVRGSQGEEWRGAHQDGRAGLIGGGKALQIPLEQMRVVAPVPGELAGWGDRKGRTGADCKLCT